MHFEHRQIIRRGLDHDLVSTVSQFALAGPLLTAENRLDLSPIQGGTGAVDQGLNDLLHGPACLKLQVAAIFNLVDGVWVSKLAALLLFQIQSEQQTSAT